MKSKSKNNLITQEQVVQLQGIRTRLDLIYKDIDKILRSLPKSNEIRETLGNIYDQSFDQLGFLDDIIAGKKTEPEYDFNKWEGTNGD